MGNVQHKGTNNTALRSLRRCLFLLSAPMVFLNFALPLRAEDLGASATEIGLLFSLFTGAVFVVRPLTGIGLDALGRKPFFQSAAIFYFVANALYALGDSIAGLLIARAMQGIGFAILAITVDTIAADISARQERSAVMGGNIASQTRGAMVGGFIGFGLVGAMPLYAWLYSFWIFTGISALALLLSLLTLPETRPAAARAMNAKDYKVPPRYKLLLIIIFGAALSAALIQPFYLIYLRARFDLELYWLATAFLPIGIAYAVLPPTLGKWTGSMKRSRVVVAGLLLTSAAYVVIPFVTDFPAVIGAFLISSVGLVLVDLTKAAWIADLSPQGATGRNFGLAAFAAASGGLLGPLLGGAIYDHLGAEWLFRLSPIILLATAMMAFRFVRDV